MSLLGGGGRPASPFFPAQRISVPVFTPPPSPARPAERVAFLPLRPTPPGSQAGAGWGSRFGMLNIKQAKPTVSGPEATRAALQDSRERPRVYTAGVGVGNSRKGGGMQSAKISPISRSSRRDLGMHGALRWRRSAPRGSGGKLRGPHAGGSFPIRDIPRKLSSS